MTLDRTLLDGEEMDMLTVLRASKDFIEFMRTNFAHVSEQEFRQTVVGRSEEEEDEDEPEYGYEF
jgi:hypothetical protein